MSFKINIGPNIRKSPYFDATVADGVQSFSVYNHMYIPGSFGDQDAEYERLINGVAQWDVGAQRQVELAGPDADRLVQYLTTRDIAKTKIGQGRYVPLCNHNGMLINDPVLLKLADNRYWLSIADSDIGLWAEATARSRGWDVSVFEPDVSPMALQGPKAVDVTVDLFGDWVRDLKYFWFRETELNGIPLVLARSGWSKQGGFEFYLQDGSRGVELWETVKQAGQKSGIGPGAPNDTERLESGLVSYGADARHLTEPANPFEVGLGALVNFDSGGDFIGRDALLEIQKHGVERERVGVFIDGPPALPNEHPVDIIQKGAGVGKVSEMTHSARLSRNIGIAIVQKAALAAAEPLTVTVDGQSRTLTVTNLPFIY